MSILSLVWNYLKSKPLNTILNSALLSLGIAVITILLLFSKQMEQKINQNTKGIDLVVGAKGSPLQLILCNLFHIDFPTGNIKLFEADRVARNRLVKKAIPLALGDSYQNFRIVGTTKDYAELYAANLITGNWWKSNMEVVLGSTAAAQLSLKIGDSFASTHGLINGGGSHDEMPFKVKGILNKSNTILDNLILTNVESIWEAHKNHNSHVTTNDSSFVPSRLVSSVSNNDSTKEITSMLIQYRSPMAAIQLPRLVNSQSNLQAASPAFETARLFSILGVGVEILTGFAYVLIFISALSIFIALYNSLLERRYDMAIMRSMGATRSVLVQSILLEGSLLTLFGSTLGLLLGHIAIMLMGMWLTDLQKTDISGWVFYNEEWMILTGSLLLGVLCSIIPAIQAYKTNISRILAAN